MTSIGKNLLDVHTRIETALKKSNRATDIVRLLAVSKKKPASLIREAAQAGQQDFGENYVQEAVEKIDALSDLDLVWHFIGPLQSNKTRLVAERFHWVHTVDRFKIAQRLSAQRPQGMPKLQLCIQVNIDDEDSKAGVNPKEVQGLAQQMAVLENIECRGLMAIPKKTDNDINQQAFQSMKKLFEEIKENNDFPNWDTLSMGMSQDFEAAIAHGATIIRVGTDIFGIRG